MHLLHEDMCPQSSDKIKWDLIKQNHYPHISIKNAKEDIHIDPPQSQLRD